MWVEDLLGLYQQAIDRIDVAAGKVFNAGGGVSNVMSLRERLGFLSELKEEPVTIRTADWRPGDQKGFIVDISKVELGLRPTVTPAEGVRKLSEWTHLDSELLQEVLG